jgi:hypothetical protein
VTGPPEDARARVQAGPPDDIQRLQEQFGDQGWRFGTVWASAASGPDKRRLYAARDTTLITAWTAEELVILIQHEP